MSDTYQAIYDAVRSKIHGGDISGAVERAVRDCNMSHYADMAHRAVQEAAWQFQRPSTLFRPRVSIDGNKWCALYGENLQDGVAGFGNSPAEAMADFDTNWLQRLSTATPAPGDER